MKRSHDMVTENNDGEEDAGGGSARRRPKPLQQPPPTKGTTDANAKVGDDNEDRSPSMMAGTTTTAATTASAMEEVYYKHDLLPKVLAYVWDTENYFALIGVSTKWRAAVLRMEPPFLETMAQLSLQHDEEDDPDRKITKDVAIPLFKQALVALQDIHSLMYRQPSIPYEQQLQLQQEDGLDFIPHEVGSRLITITTTKAKTMANFKKWPSLWPRNHVTLSYFFFILCLQENDGDHDDDYGDHGENDVTNEMNKDVGDGNDGDPHQQRPPPTHRRMKERLYHVIQDYFQRLFQRQIRKCANILIIHNNDNSDNSNNNKQDDAQTGGGGGSQRGGDASSYRAGSASQGSSGGNSDPLVQLETLVSIWRQLRGISKTVVAITNSLDKFYVIPEQKRRRRLQQQVGKQDFVLPPPLYTMQELADRALFWALERCFSNVTAGDKTTSEATSRLDKVMEHVLKEIANVEQGSSFLAYLPLLEKSCEACETLRTVLIRQQQAQAQALSTTQAHAQAQTEYDVPMGSDGGVVHDIDTPMGELSTEDHDSSFITTCETIVQICTRVAAAIRPVVQAMRQVSDVIQKRGLDPDEL